MNLFLLVLQSLRGVPAVWAVLLICIGMGVPILRLLQTPKTPTKWRAVTVVFAAFAGLRLATWLAHLIALTGASFVLVNHVITAAGVIGLLSLSYKLITRAEKVKLKVTWPAVLVGVFVAVVATASVFAPPTAWDLFTHWLLLPHEIVNNDSLLSLNTQTNSVAPDYALHLPYLGATLMSYGTRDGWLNATNIFIVTGALIVVDTSLRLARTRRPLRRALSFLALALLTASELIFGFFYGDALLILGITLAIVGIQRAPHANTLKHRLSAAGLMSAPLVGKGYGDMLSMGFAATILLLCLNPRLRQRGHLAVTSALTFVFVIVERVAFYRLTIRPAESNGLITTRGAMSSLPQRLNVESLRDTGERLFGTPDRALLVLAFLMVVLGLISVRSRKTIIPWGVPLLTTAGFLCLAVFLQRDISGSLPRYSFALVPPLILGFSSMAGAFPKTRTWMLGAACIAGTTTFARGEVPSYLKAFFPHYEEVILSHRGNDPETLEVRDALNAVAEKHPEVRASDAKYLLFNETWDGFMSFRVLVHLTLAGYRGHVFTETHTSRSDDRGERLTAARAAFAARNIEALRVALSGISVVIINMPSRPLGEAPRAMWAADFLALAEAQFAKK